MSASTARVPAPTRPVARVLPLLGLSPLDRLFDYKVDATQDDAAQPGTRIRVYFSGRLPAALIIARGDTTDSPRDAWALGAKLTGGGLGGPGGSGPPPQRYRL